MDLTAVIIIVIAVILVGFAVVAAVRRRDGSVQAAVEAAVAQVAEEARSAFDTRLATGTVELEQRHQAIDKQLETIRSGFSEQMTTMRQTLSEIRTDAASQHSSIRERLKDAVDRTSELNKTTRQLSDVLSNPTSRGKWGELMAEDILRVVGMKEGINYLKQTRIASGKIPDYTFLLPKGEKLHMDVKFPLEAHSEHLEASSEAQRKEATKKFKLAVRNHVNNLVGREGYLDSQETIDCVLMFIPNDGVYAAVQEQCQDEAEKALEKGVLICSPSTLLAVLEHPP